LHNSDLLLLINDYFLCDSAQLLIMAVTELNARHINGALVMRHHHCDEVPIDVTGRRYGHGRVHSHHALIHFIGELPVCFVHGQRDGARYDE
jgi:hypothetical protein